MYEVFFVYQDALKRGSRFDIPVFDLYGGNVDVLCGFQDSSRFNKRKPFPWEGFKTLLPNRTWPPREGDSLRAQFFRFEALRYHGKTVTESAGWALNEHGVYDSHLPEKFAYLHFTG